VLNAKDSCPNRPARTDDGCPAGASARPPAAGDPLADGDRDGVVDAKDSCPKISASTDNGCPSPPADRGTAAPAPGDHDGDGIPNRIDPDRDGDGVANAVDRCPNRAGENGNECPARAVARSVPADPAAP
jgi:hypothetical protein